MLTPTRFLLLNTSHPGNIGASARAMKTMGLGELCLVQPTEYPSAEATARASGADDLLARARVFDSLDDALQGCNLVIGASARARSIPCPLLDARECAAMIAGQADGGQADVLFGNEQSGLSNAEMDRCQYQDHNQRFDRIGWGCCQSQCPGILRLVKDRLFKYPW